MPDFIKVEKRQFVYSTLLPLSNPSIHKIRLAIRTKPKSGGAPVSRITSVYIAFKKATYNKQDINKTRIQKPFFWSRNHSLKLLIRSQ